MFYCPQPAAYPPPPLEQAHAKPPRRYAPARLNKWAKSCILRGIRPVPDALSLEEDDDSDQDTGRSSRGRGRGVVGVSFETQSWTPAIPSPRVAQQPEAAAAGKQPASSPAAPSDDLARSSSLKTSSRAVSPSSAPRPLPLKASTAVEPKPTEPVASSAVLDRSAGSAKTAPRVVSPSSSPPPLPRKASAIVGPPPTEPVTAGQPADASLDTTVVQGQERLEACATPTKATPAAGTESVGTSAFAAFPASPEPSGESAAFGEDEFVWSEAAAITPEMPRHPPPRVPTTPPADGGESRGFSDKEGGGASAGGSSSGDGDGKGVPAAAVGGDSAASAEVDADGGGDGGDWSDDPFDSFQSAPPASSLTPPPPPSVLEFSPRPATTADVAAADRTSSPSPPVDASPWNLDFLMAPPPKGAAGEGRVSPTPSAGFRAGGSSTGEGGKLGKPLDLVRWDPESLRYWVGVGRFFMWRPTTAATNNKLPWSCRHGCR